MAEAPGRISAEFGTVKAIQVVEMPCSQRWQRSWVKPAEVEESPPRCQVEAGAELLDLEGPKPGFVAQGGR